MTDIKRSDKINKLVTRAITKCDEARMPWASVAKKDTALKLALAALEEVYELLPLSLPSPTQEPAKC